MRVSPRKMKITKRQLKRIIKEERTKLLKEWGGDHLETGSDLIEFARAYAGLGGAVQEQVDAIVAAYNNSGPQSDAWQDVVWDQNPNAIDMAMQRLGNTLRMMDDDDSDGILEALEEAQRTYNEGGE